jgi:hypothetical protein
VSLASSTALLVATLDLQLTHSIVSAIRKADFESDKALGDIRARGVDQFQPRERLHPEAVESRQVNGTVLRGSNRILPREVIRPTAATSSEPAHPEHAHPIDRVFQPPWKTLPYPDKLHPYSKIKRIAHQPDIPHKGTMIDFFC